MTKKKVPAKPERKQFSPGDTALTATVLVFYCLGIAAWSAQIGSTSVTFTRAPAPCSEAAEPLPTSP